MYVIVVLLFQEYSYSDHVCQNMYIHIALNHPIQSYFSQYCSSYCSKLRQTSYSGIVSNQNADVITRFRIESFCELVYRRVPLSRTEN